MATICAWCQGLIQIHRRGAAARQAAPASHGICPACLSKQLGALPPASAPPSIRA